MDPLIFLILLGLGALVWQNAMRDRENALRAVRAACERHDVQLLDGSVYLVRTRPARGAHGRFCFRRHYRFEFSDDGGSRRQGELELLCGRTQSLRLALADYTLHEGEENSGTHTLH